MAAIIAGLIDLLVELGLSAAELGAIIPVTAEGVFDYSGLGLAFGEGIEEFGALGLEDVSEFGNIFDFTDDIFFPFEEALQEIQVPFEAVSYPGVGSHFLVPELIFSADATLAGYLGKKVANNFSYSPIIKTNISETTPFDTPDNLNHSSKVKKINKIKKKIKKNKHVKCKLRNKVKRRSLKSFKVYKPRFKSKMQLRNIPRNRYK